MTNYRHGGNIVGKTMTPRQAERFTKANADWWRDAWLRDHPGKTLADYEIAGSCADTKKGRTEHSEWVMAKLRPTNDRARA